MAIVASNSITVSNVSDGTITHTAYSKSIDGADGFTTTYPNLNLLNFNSGVTLGKYYGWAAGITSFSGNRAYFNKVKVTPNNKYTISANWSNAEWLNVYAFVNESDTTAVARYGSRYGSGGVQEAGSWDYNFVDSYLARNNMTFTVPSNVNYIGVSYCSLSKNTLTLQSLLNGKPKLEQGSIATPYMQSASEVTTADWPKYIGHYTDFMQADSTNPSDYTWGPMRGDDGVGVKTTTITYAISTSGTTAPSTGWTSSVPSLVKGQYLWTKTAWTYTDNSSETGYSVTYISKDGNNGTNGIAGKDGVGIRATAITYASHTNGTTAPTTGYTTAVPSVPAGQFLWTKTVWTYTDNSTETGYSVALMGLKGDKGDQGNNGTNGIAGKDGKGIKATAITYQASTNGTTAPTGTWSTGVPTVAKGSFLWTRTIWTYTDNTTETGYAVAYMGTNGNNGTDGIAGKDGVGIQTTTITYAGSTSGTTAPTSGWTSTVPTVAAGSYLWTKTVWDYTDNTSETGYSVAMMGVKGERGKQIFKSSYESIPNGTGHYWSDLSPAPSIDNPPKIGDTVITPSGNILQIDTVNVGGGGGGGTFGVGDVLGNIKGPSGTDGTSGIIVSSVAPASPQNGQLWQDTSTTPQLVKKWTGSSWVIWELYAQNLKADNLEVISSKIGKIYNEFSASTGGIDSNGTITIEDSVNVVYYLGNSSTTIDLVTSSSGQGLFTQHLPDKTDTSKFKQSWYMPTGLYFTDSINNWNGQITAENVTLVPWTNLTYLSGYTTAENNPCQYRKIKNLDGSYTVQFRGQVKPVSGNFPTTNFQSIAVLPTNIRPTTNSFANAVGDVTGTQTIRIGVFVDGGVQIGARGTATSYVAIDSLSYTI